MSNVLKDEVQKHNYFCGDIIASFSIKLGLLYVAYITSEECTLIYLDEFNFKMIFAKKKSLTNARIIESLLLF